MIAILHCITLTTTIPTTALPSNFRLYSSPSTSSAISTTVLALVYAMPTTTTTTTASRKRKMDDKNAQKYYAVRAGVRPGIYLTWNECQAQIAGFKGAQCEPGLCSLILSPLPSFQLSVFSALHGLINTDISRQELYHSRTSCSVRRRPESRRRGKGQGRPSLLRRGCWQRTWHLHRLGRGVQSNCRCQGAQVQKVRLTR